MQNLLVKVSLKYAFILGGINLVFGIINALTFDPNSFSKLSSMITGVLSYIILAIFLAIAHYEFNKKNGYYISFKDAILIGLIIIGVTFVISTISAFINYTFFIKDTLPPFEADASTLGLIIIASLTGVLIQILVLFLVITAESRWKIYKKAGKEGWAALIPLYNIIVFLEIIEKPLWWLIMLLIPGVNIVFSIWMLNLLAKRFDKDEAFTIGLLFLPFIFYPLLGMSKAQYIDDL